MRPAHRLGPWFVAAALLWAAPALGEDPPPAQLKDQKAAAEKALDERGPEVAPADDPGGIRRDPVEKDPRHADVFAKIDEEVEALLKEHPARGAMGFCHVFWATKKRLLQEKYGIEWRAPDEMNPQVIFD